MKKNKQKTPETVAANNYVNKYNHVIKATVLPIFAGMLGTVPKSFVKEMEKIWKRKGKLKPCR